MDVAVLKCDDLSCHEINSPKYNIYLMLCFSIADFFIYCILESAILLKLFATVLLFHRYLNSVIAISLALAKSYHPML